jgi:hypothetical protein
MRFSFVVKDVLIAMISVRLNTLGKVCRIFTQCPNVVLPGFEWCLNMISQTCEIWQSTSAVWYQPSSRCELDARIFASHNK